MRGISIFFLLFGVLCFGQNIQGTSNILTIHHSNDQFFGVSNSVKIKKSNLVFSGKCEPTYLDVNNLKFAGTSNTLHISYGVEAVVVQPPNVPLQKSVLAVFIPEVKEEIDVEIKEDNSPQYYSLFIGVQDYENDGFTDLNNPIADASNLRDVLIGKYKFQEDKSIFLKNPTRSEILTAFEKFAVEIKENDNLLIFYAGHGVWDSRIKVGYWLPADVQLNNKSSWLSNSTIRDYLAGINSKHTLLITDACFSGSIFKMRDVQLNPLGMNSLYSLSSREAMTSGTLTTVPDESKFLFYLMKRLNEHEGDFLSASQLFYSIEPAVLNNTNTVPQFGVIQDAGDEGGDFIFLKK